MLANERRDVRLVEELQTFMNMSMKQTTDTHLANKKSCEVKPKEKLITFSNLPDDETRWQEARKIISRSCFSHSCYNYELVLPNEPKSYLILKSAHKELLAYS